MAKKDGDTPRQAKAEARRRQVMDAAGECFRRNGFHSASMSQICKRAGMSAGHVYNYFTCKEELIEAIVQQDLAEILALIDSLKNSDEGEDVVDTVVSQLWQGVDHALDVEKSAVMLEVLVEATRNPKVAQMVRQSDRTIRDRVKAVLRTSEKGIKNLSDRDLEARLEVLSALFNGLMFCAVMNPDLDRETVTKVLRKVALSILDSD